MSPHHRLVTFAAILSLVCAPAFAAVVPVPCCNPAVLQQALADVQEGDILELGAGTFPAPDGGFRIVNPNASFTVRAEAGAAVFLDGGGSQPVLKYLVDNLNRQGYAVFEELSFRNGLSTVDGTAPGVTLSQARATFRSCSFEDNTNDAPAGGGGGLALSNASQAFVVGSSWTGNTARNGGGAARIGGDSTLWVHDSTLSDNRSNLAGHRPSSTAGGIDVLNSTLRVTNSRFEGNQAGFAGGAIYALGNYEPGCVARPEGSITGVCTPQADVLIANSTFDGNRAVPDPGITTPSPSGGGALHAENQTLIRVFNSRFLGNSAELGGAISTYRAEVEIYASALRGNFTDFPTNEGGRGGTIKATSNDANDASTDFGATNRPPARLTLVDSLVQGRFGGATNTALRGGCLFAQGDTNRTFGNNPNVPPMGTPEDNRAVLIIDGTVFYDCDVEYLSGFNGSGVGGGLQLSHTALTLSDSLLMGSDASGERGDGGAVRVVTESAATVTGTTFAKNTAERFGAALYVSGSQLTVDDCAFIENELSPGTSEAETASTGAAIFATPAIGLFGSVDIDVTGTVSSSTFSNNVGLDVWDADRSQGPINDLRYDGNEFFSDTFGTLVYRDQVAAPARDAAGLNSLIVTRDTGVPSTDKSQIDNVELGAPAVAGAILAVPPEILLTNGRGDPPPPTESFLAFAWSGGNATLDGGSVAGNTGLVAGGVGVHTLSVGGSDFLATISAGAFPTATLTAVPPSISAGETADLVWSSAGTFVDLALDQGLSVPPAAAGSTPVMPAASTTYTVLLAAAEGGATDTARVFVDEEQGLIFADGFESGDTSAWSLVVP